MHTKRLLLISLTFLASHLAVANAALSLSQNHPTGLYAKGETIKITATNATGEANAEVTVANTIHLKILKNNTEILTEKDIPLTGNLQTIYEASFDLPCSLIAEASIGDQKNSIGAIVAPDELQAGSPRPADFDAFWDARKKAIAELPLEVTMDRIDLDAADQSYQAFDVEINSPGPRPARAIFVKPANAADRSLPIVIKFRAAGVKGDWCRSHLNETLDLAKKGKGALSLDLNAHGMLNHEEEAYYEDLEIGPLKSYWDQGNTNRDEFYFGYMYARMLRSIEFLTQQPEWDGKRILVIGESQGGGQALAAVGLDHRVDTAVVTVPALCDLGAPLVGRKGGWPQPVDWHRDDPRVAETVAYFDTAHLLAGSQATILAEIGLIDQTCPATSVYSALNQAEGNVTILPVPYRAHGWPEGPNRKHWEQTTALEKSTFIDTYLQ